MVFRRNIEDAGIRNTDIGVIKALAGTHVVLMVHDRQVQLDLSKPENSHWDYGCAITSHAFQGKDCHIALCHFDSKAKPLVNYQSHYVAVSRGEHDFFTGLFKTIVENLFLVVSLEFMNDV